MTDPIPWLLESEPWVVYRVRRDLLGQCEEDAQVQAARQAMLAWPPVRSLLNELQEWPGHVLNNPKSAGHLIVLKYLALHPDMHASDAVRGGIEAQLTLWEKRRDAHPYLFKMGTDFSMIKAPLVWYDILHVLDVLTQFQSAREDSRLQEMAASVRSKANEMGQYTPESIWTAWKDWDFAQKRYPLAGITTFILRMFRRAAFV